MGQVGTISNYMLLILNMYNIPSTQCQPDLFNSAVVLMRIQHVGDIYVLHWASTSDVCSWLGKSYSHYCFNNVHLFLLFFFFSCYHLHLYCLYSVFVCTVCSHYMEDK